MWAWVIRLAGGFIPGLTKPFGEWIGKIIWVAVWIVIALTVYHKIFEPKTVTKIERIETQINNQCPEENRIVGLRLNFWKFKIGAGI